MASKTQSTNVTQQKKVYVKSESAFEEMKANSQLEPLTDYYTPDDSNAVFMPVGAIFSSAIPQTDARVHLLDGSTIPQTGMYAEFATLLKSLTSKYAISCSAGAYQSDLDNFGQCGKFVIDNVAGTIRLPTITKFIEGMTSLANIGQSFGAGLPNITGNLGPNTFTSGEPFDNGTALSASGRWSGPDGQGWVMTQLNLDASKSNSIYGKSTTVQPQSTAYPYYIVLAGGYKSTQQVNFDNFGTELNGKLAKIDVKRYPIETWKSGNMWYTKYNDGLKECGGMYFMGNNGHFSAQITLPLEFSNKNYTLVTSLYRDETSPDTAGRALTQDYNHTYNSFGFCCNATGNCYCSFYARGY